MNIVYENIDAFIEGSLNDFPGELGELQRFATKEGFPIIQKSTARFLSTLVAMKKPMNVLEIGCCIGFSASLIAHFMPEEGHVTTIDRFEYMIEKAKETFTKFGLNHKVTLMEGDARELLPQMDERFDFIFIDAAKAQYMQFLPHCLRMLNVGGVIVADDILKDGYVTMAVEDVPRRHRTTHRRMKSFIHSVTNTENLESSIIPIGHGVLLCTKMAEDVEINYLDE